MTDKQLAAPDKERQVGLALGLSAFFLWGFLPAYYKLTTAVPADVVVAHRILWSVVAVGAHLYLYGGRGRGEGCPGWCNYNRLYRYDPSSNTWARMADAPGGENSGPGSRRGGLAADPDVPLAEAKIYMHKAMEDAVYAYSVAGDTWETYAVGMNDAGGNSVKRGGGMSGLVALHGRLLYVSGSRWNYATGSWDEWTNIVDVR